MITQTDPAQLTSYARDPKASLVETLPEEWKVIEADKVAPTDPSHME